MDQKFHYPGHVTMKGGGGRGPDPFIVKDYEKGPLFFAALPNYYNFSLVYFALICFCTKVLINLFISALWTTPNDSIGLTALATWILGCIAFVFIALLFYVVILINMKVVSKRVNAKVSSFGAKKWKSDDPRVPRDMDPLFLMIHLLAFALFVITYFFVYIA